MKIELSTGEIVNDERVRVKKEINVKYGSDFVEEKSYKDY